MRSLVPDGDLGAIIEAAVSEKLERLEARRFGATDRYLPCSACSRHTRGDAGRTRANAGPIAGRRLIAGMFLLGFTGVGGENTDVPAHLTGFITGSTTGWWLGRLTRIPGRRSQWLAGLGALAGIAAAWWAALTLGA